MINLRLRKEKRKSRSNNTIRFSDDEYNKVMQKALVFCEGNFSEFVRYAAQNFEPMKKDLEPDKKQ